MNKKQLLVALVLGLILVGVALMVSRKQQAAYQLREPTDRKVLGDFDLNSIESIHIRSGTNDLLLSKKNDLWVVEQRNAYPANFSMINDLMRKLWELKAVRFVPSAASRLAALKLEGPDKNSTLLELKDANGTLVRSLLLGVESKQNDRQWDTGRYVMVDNNPQSVALVADAFSTVDTSAPSWLNKDFFKVERIKSISLVATNAVDSWTVTRDSESADWTLSDAKPDEKIDSSKTVSLKTLFSSPSFVDVITESNATQTGLDHPVLVTISTFDGFTYSVRLGHHEEDYFIQLSVTADLPKERTAGLDETTEDKATRDKEFADKREKLEQKLKTEKAFENRVYAVSKWTVDPLLKTRRDLLADSPKTTETPDAKTGAQPDPSAP